MSIIDVNIKTMNPGTTVYRVEELPPLPCDIKSERVCPDGSCVLKNELCDEEEILNQNTILIMIVIGLAVVIFLIILYCFQQKTHRTGRNQESLGAYEAGIDDGDNTSLYNPPPTYDEVITSGGLYPVTPQTHRVIRMSSSEEPITPPPNYEAALTILAQSHESVLVNKTGKNNVFRRSISVDSVSRQNTNSNNTTEPRSPASATPRLPSIGQ